jgi:pseudouridine-5'-phosphate glycosidase
MQNPQLLSLNSEVADALHQGLAVVALESTVIAHGLPRPLNFETAQRVEQIVRDAGATPATIAVLDGQLCVGLSRDQIRFIADGNDIKKISTRDLPIARARGWNGATTVASTIWIAQRAGIKLLGTGGIGGVHRGVLPDISADLPELARTPITVVCSGAKIVLDLPATREWLETHGITVVGYGCDELPAFYSRRSGLPIDVRADSALEVTRIIIEQRVLGLTNALLVTVPVPEEFEVPADVLQSVLDESLEEAKSRGVVGRELTPFLLSKMSEQSKGATLKANIALLENNARVAAEIAVALVSVERGAGASHG